MSECLFKVTAGPAMSGKTYKLCKNVLQEAYKHPDQSFIIVIPDQIGNAYEKKLIEMNNELYGRPGFMNIDVIGFNRLAFRIFEDMSVPVSSVLEEYEKSMLIRVTLGELADKLLVYKRSIDRSGFIKELKSLISEFIQYDISLEDIDKLIEFKDSKRMNPALVAKLKDIKMIYGKFLELLSVRESGLSEERLKMLARVLGTDEKCRITDGTVFVFDEYRGYTPDQLRVIGALSKRAKELSFSICIEPDIIRKNIELKTHDIFYQSQKVLKSLQEVIGIKPTVVYMDGDMKCPPMLKHLKKHMMRFPISEYTGEDINSPDASLQISCMKDTESEIRVIAEDIRSFIKAGYRYKDIAVVSGDIESFDDLAGGIFEEYGIPYFVDYNRKLKKNPFTQALIKALDIVDRDYDYAGVFGLIKTGVLDLDSYAADNLENYALRSGLRGYRLWNQDIVYKGKNHSDDILAKYEGMNYVRKSIVDIMKPFDGLSKKTHKVKDYINAIRVFMQQCDFEKKIEASSEFIEANGIYGDARAMRSLWGVLGRLLDETEDFLGETSMDIHDFSEILESGINEISIGVIPPTLDSVMVMDMTRSRILETKIMFFANITDGVVPPATSSGGLISDKDKLVIDGIFDELKEGKHLSDHGIEKRVNDLFILYQLMSKPTDYLRLSYPAKNMSDVAASPSYIIGRIMRLYPGIEVRKRSVTPLLGTLQSDRLDYIYGLRDILEQLHDSEDREISPENQDILTDIAIYDRYSEGVTEQIKKGLNFSNAAGKISMDIMKNLTLKLSVSKMESYMTCPYSYFMQYVLGLQERPEKKIEYYDIGNIIHKALECTVNDMMTEHENDWNKIGDDELKTIMSHHLDEAWNEYRSNEIADISGKTEAVADNLRLLSDRTILTLKEHITKGNLLPQYTEQQFSVQFEAERPDKEKVLITILGKIDRIDTKSEEGKTYIRIIDYKTGSESFDPQRIKEGTQLQLSLYTHLIKKILTDRLKDTEVIPVGMYYYHVANPVVGAPSEFTLQKKYNGDEAQAERDEILKQLKLSGVSDAEPKTMLNLHDSGMVSDESGQIIRDSQIIPVGVNKDGEYKAGAVVADKDSFDAIGEYSMRKMKEGADRILAGFFEKSPIKYNGQQGSACAYCSYKPVCRFGKMAGHERKIPKAAGTVRDQIKELK
ncbi:MAG: exodeoxyribonuclease V subunit gamma [Eubacterium sp.]|nr:exodeoxyribonuclease V subunit gamma [Eubacterium sp.]